MTEFKMLPKEIKDAFGVVSAVKDKKTALKKEMTQLEAAQEYKDALALIRDKGQPIIDKIRAEIAKQKDVLSILGQSTSSGTGGGGKSKHDIVVSGDIAIITNTDTGQTLDVPAKDVKYSVAFLGKQDGSEGGVIAEIGLTHQQGKGIVKKFKTL